MLVCVHMLLGCVLGCLLYYNTRSVTVGVHILWRHGVMSFGMLCTVMHFLFLQWPVVVRLCLVGKQRLVQLAAMITAKSKNSLCMAKHMSVACTGSPRIMVLTGQ